MAALKYRLKTPLPVGEIYLDRRIIVSRIAVDNKTTFW